MVLRGFVTSVLLALTLTLLASPAALAQEPSPPPGAVASPVLIDPLDPRAGEGASQVGAPLLALLVVIIAGVVAASVTYGYVRLVRSR
jgi:hypothetical protein